MTLERLYTLAEAATALQVTDEDVRNPQRWVRDRVRALKLSYVRIGRVVKLPHSTLVALRAATTHSAVGGLAIDTELPSIGAGRSASTRRALARIAEANRRC